MKIAIFPAGAFAQKLCGILEHMENVEVRWLADNDPNKIGKLIKGVSVISPYKLQKLYLSKEVDVVLVASNRMLSYALWELTGQLESLGIDSYCVAPSWLFQKKTLTKNDYNAIFTRKENLTQLSHLQFHVADNCNLKCKRCQHFSNLIKENRFADFDSLAGDFSRLKEIFSHINSIGIMGGEPLLNPELWRYCYMVRAAFPYAQIELITNGLLIRTMPEQLIKAVKENDILINISYYPVLTEIIDETVEFLIKNGIRYYIGKQIRSFSKKMTLSDLSDPDRQFPTCRDRCCTTLREGKLYPCYLPATVSVFREKFGVPIDGGNSCIDIYETGITAEKILERLRHGFGICSYCTGDEFYEWERSETADMEDWIV